MLRVFSRSSAGLKGWRNNLDLVASSTFCSARSASSSTSILSAASSQHTGLVIRDGKAVLYRGPPAMKKWIFFFIGGVFVCSGITMAHNLYYHMAYPLTFKDPDNPPKLVDFRIRIAAASIAGTIGVLSGCAIFWIPSTYITKLTLLIPTRQLAIQTSSRPLSALLPRFMFPQPFRRTAELKGYYLTGRNNERVVPLSSVFRNTGSASDTGSNLSPQQKLYKKNIALDERYCVELRVLPERMWYRLESSGGADPPKGHGYRGFWRRIQHRLRGVTDWQGEKELLLKGNLSHLGKKEPWFADRRTFDDVVPLIRRR